MTEDKPIFEDVRKALLDIKIAVSMNDIKQIPKPLEQALKRLDELPALLDGMKKTHPHMGRLVDHAGQLETLAHNACLEAVKTKLGAGDDSSIL